MKERHWNLPLGGVTLDPDEYANAWTELIQPLLKALGPNWHIFGFGTMYGYTLHKTIPNILYPNTFQEIDRLSISVEAAVQLMSKLQKE